jgi:hypothetical protein
MFEHDSDEVEQLEKRIIAVIFPPDAPPGQGPSMEVMLNALCHVLSFCIAFACTNCRKRISHQLRKRVPAIILDANRLAALSQRTEHLHLH